VLRMDEQGNDEQITELIDTDALEHHLLLMKGSRYRLPFAPYSRQYVSYEIDGRYGSGHFHIILGEELACIYESGEKGGYSIEDSQAWLDIMEGLM